MDRNVRLHLLCGGVIARAETEGIGGNGRGEWLSRWWSGGMLRTGGRLSGGDGAYSFSGMLRSSSGGLPGSDCSLLSMCGGCGWWWWWWAGRWVWGGWGWGSTGFAGASGLWVFLTQRFSAVSSGWCGDDGLVRSWAPHSSPDLLLGLACFLRGMGEAQSCLDGRRLSAKLGCDMCGNFNGGSKFGPGRGEKGECRSPTVRTVVPGVGNLPKP